MLKASCGQLSLLASPAFAPRNSNSSLRCRAPAQVRPLRRRQINAMALGAEALQARLAAAKRAVRLACRLCQAVQKKLVQGESANKADKSPVTVADYGAQVLVCWALEKEHPSGEPFSMVAEEDSSDFASEAGKAMLSRITELVNDTLLAEHQDLSSSAPAGAAQERLSEEEVVRIIDKGASPGGASGRHWVLDPIDGTRGFLRGDQYAVALGLLDEGQVVLGVLGCPNLPMAPITQGIAAAVQTGAPVGCVFSALKGDGTTAEALDGSQAKKVNVSAITDSTLATFCESYESAHSQHDLTAGIAEILGVTAPPVRIDSQAKYGAMARGDAAIYLRFPHAGYREKIWDHAAGSIVITEAGGVVSDAAGKPLDFSRGRYLDLDTGILATNQALYPKLLAAVQTALKRGQPTPL